MSREIIKFLRFVSIKKTWYANFSNKIHFLVLSVLLAVFRLLLGSFEYITLFTILPYLLQTTWRKKMIKKKSKNYRKSIKNLYIDDTGRQKRHIKSKQKIKLYFSSETIKEIKKYTSWFVLLVVFVYSECWIEYNFKHSRTINIH